MRTLSISPDPGGKKGLMVVGTIGTLISRVANVSAVFALKGLEPAFVSSREIRFDIRFVWRVVLPT